ncbi:MAG: AI-2E family transporter [Oscillospiraceae bacterium]|nr:AI-2E family transporter [Oscillospiraceae bacterium]
MKLNKENTKKIILILCSAILFCIGLINLSSVWAFILGLLRTLTPLIIGLCIAFVLKPLTAVIEKKMLGFLSVHLPRKGKTVARGLSVALSLIIVAGIIALILLLVIPEVQDAFTILGNTLPASFTTLFNNINDILARFDINFRIPVGDNSGWIDLLTTAKSYLQSAFESGALSDIASTALSVLGGLMNFVLGIIFSIYVLMQREKISAFIKRFVKAYAKDKVASHIFHVAHQIKVSFRNFVTGQLTEAVIIGLLCFFGMLIFRFPYPTATSAVVSVMAIFPVVGAWIGAILGALLCLSDSFTRALLFVLFFIILQQLENNLIYPRVVGKSLGLPGMLVFVSVILGASFGGIVGILLAVPLCSVLFVLTKEGIEYRLNKKKIIKNLEDIGMPPDDKS